MHPQALPKTGPTLPPVASLLDGLMARSPNPESLSARIARLPAGASPIKNRHLYRRMQQIEQLPRRDQDALLRTIEAFISKTA